MIKREEFWHRKVLTPFHKEDRTHRKRWANQTWLNRGIKSWWIRLRKSSLNNRVGQNRYLLVIPMVLEPFLVAAKIVTCRKEHSKIPLATKGNLFLSHTELNTVSECVVLWPNPRKMSVSKKSPERISLLFMLHKEAWEVSHFGTRFRGHVYRLERNLHLPLLNNTWGLYLHLYFCCAHSYPLSRGYVDSNPDDHLGFPSGGR